MRRVTEYEWREGRLHLCRTPRGGLAVYYGASLVALSTYQAEKVVSFSAPLGAIPKLKKYCSDWEVVPFNYVHSLLKVETVIFWELRKKKPAYLAAEFGEVWVSVADSYASGNCYRGSAAWIRERYGAAGGAPLRQIVADMGHDYRAFDAAAWAAAVYISRNAGEWPNW